MRIIKNFHGIFLVSILLFTSVASAQVDLYQRSLFEIKFGVGGTVFLGDLGGSKGAGKPGLLDFDLSSLRQNSSIGLKLNLSNKVSIRGDVFYARLFGSDVLSQNPYRHNRNLSFRADLSEISITAEVVSFNLAKFSKNKTNTSELYAFAGFGWIHFNPQGYYKGKWYDLQPLGTEGQGLIPGKEKYSLNSVVIPFGIGYRKNISKSVYLGMELSMRKSQTDYIDDVSGTYANVDVIRENHGDLAAQLSDRRIDKSAEALGRGNPGQNDNYSFVQITIAKGFGKSAARQQLKIISQKKNHTVLHKCPRFK